MPTDLGLDTELESVENTSGTSTGFATRIITLLQGLVESTGNPFGSAATAGCRR